MPFWKSSAIAVLLSVSGGVAGPMDGPRLGAIQARLFYKETGRLSENVLGRTPEFVGVNALIGEGDAEEYVDDLLVTVTVETRDFSADDSRSYPDPLVIQVTDATGKVLAARRFEGGLTSRKGSETKALWVPDASCAGRMRISASLRGQRRTAELTMGCGE